MISRVRGALLRRGLETVEIMTAGGVAYQVAVPLGVYERLPREGEEVELRTFQVVREDSVELFGFLDAGERALFGRLLGAPGVGPRLALSMLSALAPERLVGAIRSRDIAALRQVPGLGTKKAEKLVVEMADKLDDLAFGTEKRPKGRAAEEAVSALVALGYPAVHASTAVRGALDQEGGLEGAALIKAALVKIGGDG
ncbi:MAG: Holliday junction branch migration protein RuvA [Longimicrobiales bacterium]